MWLGIYLGCLMLLSSSFQCVVVCSWCNSRPDLRSIWKTQNRERYIRRRFSIFLLGIFHTHVFAINNYFHRIAKKTGMDIRLKKRKETFSDELARFFLWLNWLDKPCRHFLLLKWVACNRNFEIRAGTLWCQLEEPVLLIGTVLLFSPIFSPKYKVWLLIGSIP